MTDGATRRRASIAMAHELASDAANERALDASSLRGSEGGGNGKRGHNSRSTEEGH